MDKAKEYAQKRAVAWEEYDGSVVMDKPSLERELELAYRAGMSEVAGNILDPDKKREG